MSKSRKSKYRWALLHLLLCIGLATIFLLYRPIVPLNVVELQQVPDELDNLYKYNVNSLSDLVTYEDDNGDLVQAYIYWADNRRLHIAKRQFPSGEFGDSVDVHTAIGDEPLEYDSHNSSALGVASNGIMFITGNHHVDPLNMGKTRSPYDIQTFFNVNSGLLASDIDRVTYPEFFHLNGVLYLSYRDQDTGKNAPRFRWLTAYYDEDSERWMSGAQLNTGIGLRLYVSNFAVSNDGKTVHLFALWRDDKAGGGTAQQHDYFHLYSDDGSNWYNYQAGLVVSENSALWFDNGDKTLPGYTGVQLQSDQLIWDTPPDPGPVNAGAAVVDAEGYPHALVRSRSGVLYHHHWNGREWRQDILDGWSGHSHDMVACGSGVGALIAQQERIVYRSLNKNDASYNEPVVLAEGFTNTHYTLSIDKKASARGYVSFLLTKSTHFLPRRVQGVNPQRAWIATFSCADIESAPPFKLASS